MKYSPRVIEAFLALVRAGLWEQPVSLPSLEESDWDAILALSEEQTVVGLVGDGLSRASGSKPPKAVRNAFISTVYATEHRNAQMDAFLAAQYAQLQAAGIKTVVLKGQGVARCYSHPQWRQSGDIDYLLESDDYTRAKSILVPSSNTEPSENVQKKHLALQIDTVEIELHGTVHAELSRRMDVELDKLQAEMFSKSLFRSWQDAGVDILLPSPDVDVVFVFTHILQHLFKGGIGLRQICDWCRLLWTYRDAIDRNLLEERLRAMKLKSEWYVFAAFAVNGLGMSVDAMPFYRPIASRRIHRLSSYILEVGNFGHNRDISYQRRGLPIFIRKCITFGRQAQENFRLVSIFPLDSIRFLFGYVLYKI